MHYVRRAERRWVRPGDDDDEEDLLRPPCDREVLTMEVLENDPEPTGLLDHNGHPLYRTKHPIGFRFSENE